MTLILVCSSCKPASEDSCIGFYGAIASFLKLEMLSVLSHCNSMEKRMKNSHQK